MTTSKVPIDGTDTPEFYTATYSVSEDAVTKEVQRVALNDSAGAAISTLPVSVASAVPVTDNGGSLTVDAPVGTPAFVRLSDGAAAITTLSVDPAGTSIGSLTETAPATDTASSGLNGRLQRIAQRLTTQIGVLPTSRTSAGGLRCDGSTVVDAGDVAHDTVDSGNPVKVGGQARTTNPTAVADGDRSNLITDKLSKLIAVSAIRELKGSTQTQITTAAETTVVSAVASTFMDLYGLVLANTGVAATKVTIRDDTAGTVRGIFQVPAGDTRGFMLDAGSALPQTTVNKNWTATCATTTTIEVTAMWVKNI